MVKPEERGKTRLWWQRMGEIGESWKERRRGGGGEGEKKGWVGDGRKKTSDKL
jgi:hypothetical protein